MKYLKKNFVTSVCVVFAFGLVFILQAPILYAQTYSDFNACLNDKGDPNACCDLPQFKTDANCVGGTSGGIQGGRSCPLNQTANPCASGLKCVPGSCVSPTQLSTPGICVVASFTCVSSGTDYNSCIALGGSNTPASCCGAWPVTCPDSVKNANNQPPPVNNPPPVTPGPALNDILNSPASAPSPCGDPSLESINGICVPKGNFPAKSVAGSTTLVGLILLVLNYLLILSGLIAVVALVIGGFWYITAAGNEEQAEKGRKALLNAIIGMVVIIMAYAIVNILTRTLTTTDITKTTGN